MADQREKFTQSPTPLDCISSTLRAPPKCAPHCSATPSSSVVTETEWTPGSAIERLISSRCPASGTYENWVTSNSFLSRS